MSNYPPSIINLIKNLSKLPGIGPKSGERLAMHILKADHTEARALAKSIIDVKEKVRLCSKCFALSDREVCNICSDSCRDMRLVCVVEQPADMSAIEKAGGFPGVYHILQGVLSPMDGVGPDQLRIKELIHRIAADKVSELVIATGTNVEGDVTASYLCETLSHQTAAGLKITRIASGVPIGGDLKFIDQVTLKKAMERRHAI